jgi:ketosteroid isomerase-like protein
MWIKEMLMRKRRIQRCAILVGLLISAGSTVAPAQKTEDGIEKIRAEWVNSFKSKNLEKLMSLYADDAAVMPPTGERIVGKEKVTAYFKNLFDSATTLDVKVGSEITKSDGELGYDSGSYEQVVMRGGTKISGGVVISGNVTIQGGGSREVSNGSYLVVLRHESNNWVIIQQVSTQRALPPAETK